MQHENPPIPTVSLVDGENLIELLYDDATHKTAFAICRDGTWSIEQEVTTSRGERLIPYAASNNLIRHACVLLPSGPVDHGDKTTLLADIETYLHRYVDFSPLFERIVAHYVLLSWVHDAFNELPYLRFKGDYGSGKTRALIAVGSIAYRGFFASGASTISPVFHTLDSFGGTLVLDEADLRFSGKTADLVKILNNGTVKGLPVLRTIQNRNKEFNPAAFQVFGPKIVAMRGRFRDEALESRFLTEEMGTRPLRAEIPIQLPDRLKVDAVALRNRLLHFRLTNRLSIQTNPTRVIAGIDPRLNQTALSLLSLVDDAILRDDLVAMFRHMHGQLAGKRAKHIGPSAIGAIREALNEPNRSAVSLREIADRLNVEAADQEGPISPREVGQALRELSIPVRKSHGTMVVPASAAAVIKTHPSTNAWDCPGVVRDERDTITLSSRIAP
jgi:hypothetical protein